MSPLTNYIVDKYRHDTYHEASFKPFVIAAMIYLTRVEKPWDVLEKLIKQNIANILRIVRIGI